jgi:hypothetical protein
MPVTFELEETEFNELCQLADDLAPIGESVSLQNTTRALLRIALEKATVPELKAKLEEVDS